jgi:hypothetical protein
MGAYLVEERRSRMLDVDEALKTIQITQIIMMFKTISD